MFELYDTFTNTQKNTFADICNKTSGQRAGQDLWEGGGDGAGEGGR